MSARALKITFTWTVLTIALTLLPHIHPLVKTLFALPLVFILPGYALTAAWFPRERLGGAETLTLSLGLSFGVTIAGGLVLNATAWGLAPLTWTIWLGGVTLLGVGVAARRGAMTPPARVCGFASSVGSISAFALSALIVVGALMLATMSAQSASAQFTQLWMRPSASARAAFEIGIGNFEARAMTYRLQVDVNTQDVYETELMLAANETRVKLLELSQDTEVRVRLYRADAPLEVYREVVWRAHIANP